MHYFLQDTQREGLKTTRFQLLKVGKFRLDLLQKRRGLQYWPNRSYYTWREGQIASNLQDLQPPARGKPLIIEVLDPLRAEQHGMLIITSFFARKWRNLNVTTVSTTTKCPKSPFPGN